MGTPLTNLPRRVRIVEVGPRDGLQNEAAAVPTPAKIALINALAEAGLRVVEVTAFVRPDLVPQLADAEAVLRGITRREGVRYPVLVLNRLGLDRALAAGADAIGVNVATTDAFNQANLRRTTQQVLDELTGLVRDARANGCWVRGYVSTGFGCPFTGPVPPQRVVPMVDRFLEMGCDEISLGDTIGVATPRQIADLIDRLDGMIGPERLALHLHDTRGTALANVLTGLEMGITIVDSSAGGLGGCPFAPGAAGNLATEDLVYLLDGLGVESGVDLQKVRAAAAPLENLLGHQIPGKVFRAGPAPGGRVA